MNIHFIVSGECEWCEWWLVHKTTFSIVNIQPFPFTLQTFHCPWEIIPQVTMDFSCKIWWFFFHFWTFMHISAKITLCKHICIKTWLKINQCKSKMIHTCHMQILFFFYTFFFHPNMLILELFILGPHLHSFAFKSNQVVSLHKSFKSLHGMASYNNTPANENIFSFSINIVEVCKFWNCNACNWRL